MTRFSQLLRTPSWIPAGAQAGIALLLLFALIRVHVPPGTGDSAMFKTGAVLYGEGMYSPERQRTVQDPLAAPFFRAPFYGGLLRVLLPFDFARALMFVNLAAAAALVFLVPAALSIPWYCATLIPFFIPLLVNVRIEQDGAIKLLLLATSLYLAESGVPILAGVVLACTLDKPTLLLLVPPVLLLHRRRRMLFGYLTAGALLAASSFWAVGGSAVADYIRLVKGFELVPAKMPTAWALAAGLGSVWIGTLPVLAAVAATLWRAPRVPFGDAYCFAIATSLFVSPQSYQHDFSLMMLPSLYFFVNGDAVSRFACAALLFPPTYLLLIPEGAWWTTVIRGGMLLAFLALVSCQPFRSTVRKA